MATPDRHTTGKMTPEDEIVLLRTMLSERDRRLAVQGRQIELMRDRLNIAARQLEDREHRLAASGEQLAGMTEYAARLETRLELERVDREAMVREEVERMRPGLETEVREVLRQEKEELERRRAELDRREADMRKDMELMLERFRAQVRQETERAKSKAMDSAEAHILGLTEGMFGMAESMLSGDTGRAEEYMAKFKAEMPRAQEAMSRRVQEALESAEKKIDARTRQNAELVRMLFTQKSERVEISEEERCTLLESVISSVKLSAGEKAELKECYRKISDFRARERLAGTLEGRPKRGHGRTMSTEGLQKLAPIKLYPEGYEGHEDEYEQIGVDEQNFVLPVQMRYVVQPIERIVVVRKDDEMRRPIQHPCYEGPIWKSKASAELLSYIETCKYAYHMPFHRLLRKMKRDGLEVSDTTVDGWHKMVCQMLEPLYELQKRRVMRSRYLAADGSPMPVLNSEKQRTTSHYVIQYRSVDTGTMVFLTTPGGSGRGKAVIEANLMEWTGSALMCDAYSGYDWVGRTGRVLCRCAAHMRRNFERAMKENPTLSMPAIALISDIYSVERMVAEEKLVGADKTARRRELAAPCWSLLKKWCMEKVLELDDKRDTAIYKAVNYLLRHYDELTNYLDIAEMPVDNNDTERHIRDMVMGKKSYMYCRTEDACRRAAMMYSFFGACKVHGKDPESWLTHVLKHIGTTTEEDLHSLLPEEWKAE